MSGLENAMEQMRVGSFDAIQKHLDHMEKSINGNEPKQQFSGEKDGQRQAMAAAIAAFAETPGGKMFLDELVSTTLWRMTYPVGIYGISKEDKCDFAAMREGQNGLVYQMLRLIAEGRGEEPPTNREVL